MNKQILLKTMIISLTAFVGTRVEADPGALTPPKPKALVIMLDVDDVAIWTRTLTHGEVQRIFSAAKDGKPLSTLLGRK